MPTQKTVALAGSARNEVPGATKSAVDPAETAEVTVVLRGRNRETSHIVPSTREKFAETHGPDPKAVKLLQEFATQHSLTVGETIGRSVKLTGTLEALSAAFSASVSNYELPDKKLTFRGRTGSIHIPVELEPEIVAVLGLDTRPVAKSHHRVAKHATPSGALSPVQVAQLYQFPTGTGAGQTIGIIELGGGFSNTDLATYFKGLGITEPKVTAVLVDKAKNQPGKDTNSDGEVMLDIEVAGAVAPGAHIVVYFAPNTDQGFTDAITQAIHDTVHKPSVVSISWGGPEDSWTAQARDAMNLAIEDGSTLGVTVTAACGDDGATDGVAASTTGGTLHLDFPASSPFALACGGTKLVGSGTKITSETVWNELAASEGATGGGVSRIFAKPSYQTNAGVPVQPDTKFVGRGTPDVSGDADPETGFIVLVDGKSMVIGGTSAVAPLWAGLIALLNQQLGTPVGFLQPKLYALKSGFHDITAGNNNGFSAGKGWDPCTGLGSPNGTALLQALKNS